MKVVDLTEQVAICGDILSNLVMVVQQLNNGEEAKILMDKDHLKNMGVYKELLTKVGAEVLETGEEDSKAYIVLRKKAQ